MTTTEMILKIVLKLSTLAVVPVEPAFDAVNEAVRHLSLKLADRNSDLVRGNYSLSTSTQTVNLPFDFNGFYGNPYADGVLLDPLPSSYDVTTAAGTPRYYDVVDTLLSLYPTPAKQVTITAKYWMLAAALGGADAIPYNGKFDSLILDMAVKISVSGYSVLSQQPFIIEVEQGIDAVIWPRKPALPSHRRQVSF